MTISNECITETESTEKVARKYVLRDSAHLLLRDGLFRSLPTSALSRHHAEIL